MPLLGEFKRRKTFQVAVAYGVVGWLLIQVADTLLPTFGAPQWVMPVFSAIVILCFPLAVILAWTLERPTRAPQASDGRLPDSSLVEARPVHEPDGAQDTLPNSVAVLPFENLSPNPEDEYFAAGIHEEILGYLTKIKDISVIARTSVKPYADTSKSIAEIAQELKVETVMEGSVRYAGDRVRVTAQLVEARTQRHLWSESYERDLADVFAIQAEVASRIAEALQAKFTVAEQESIAALPRTRSSEAHALYLKAQALFAQGDTAIAVTTPHSVRTAIHELLDEAVKRDPGFAHPYALQALLYAVSRIYDPIGRDDWLQRCMELDRAVRENADKALELSANLALPHFARALNHQFRWLWMQAREDYERAVALRPNEPEILTWFSTLKWLMGEHGEAIQWVERAVALDSRSIWAWLILGTLRHVTGAHQSSVAAFEKGMQAHPDSPLPYLHAAMPRLSLGLEKEALEGLELADSLLPSEAAPAIHVHLAYGLARMGRREAAKAKVDRIKADDRYVDPFVLGMASLSLDDKVEALHWFDKAIAEPQYRQEVFAWAFVKENWWADPVLERPEFLALRDRLDF